MPPPATRFEPLALLGAALLVGGLFLPWYSVSDLPTEFPRPDRIENYLGRTAWQAFGVVDLVLALLAVASARMRAAALAAAALIAYEMIDAPRFATLGPGPWLALAGALIAAAAPVVRPWMGAGLLCAALFAPWYGDTAYIITRGASDTETISSLGDELDRTAWQAFTVLDVALALLALAATRSRVAAAAAVAVVTFRLIDAPLPDLSLRSGAWLALAGALVALVARRGARDEVAP